MASHSLESVPERKTVKDMKKNILKDKRRKRKRNDVLNLSKWHNKSSTSFMKATLRANNTALARALERTKQESSELQQSVLELQKERHLLMCAVNALNRTNLEYEQRFANIRESLRSVTSSLLGASSMLSTTLGNCTSPVADRGSLASIISEDDVYENRKISGPSIYYKKPSYASKGLSQEISDLCESKEKIDGSLDDVSEKNLVIPEVPGDESINIRISLPSFLNDSVATDGKTNPPSPLVIEQDVCSVREQDKDAQTGDHIDTKSNKKLNFSTSFTESMPSMDDNIPKRNSQENREESCVGSSVKTINKANSFATFFPLSPKDAKLSKSSGKFKQKNTKRHSISRLVDDPFKTQSKIAHSPVTRNSGIDENQHHLLQKNLNAESTQKLSDSSNQRTENEVVGELNESKVVDNDTAENIPICEVKLERAVSTDDILNNEGTDILSPDELQYGMFGGCLDMSPELIGEEMELTGTLNASIVLNALQHFDRTKKQKNIKEANDHKLTTASIGQSDRDAHGMLKKNTGNGAEHVSDEQGIASSKHRTKTKIAKEGITSESESDTKNDFQCNEQKSQTTALKKCRKRKPKSKIPKKDSKKPSSVFDISAGEYFSHPSPSRLSKILTVENTNDEPEVKKNQSRLSKNRIGENASSKPENGRNPGRLKSNLTVEHASDKPENRRNSSQPSKNLAVENTNDKLENEKNPSQLSKNVIIEIAGEKPEKKKDSSVGNTSDKPEEKTNPSRSSKNFTIENTSDKPENKKDSSESLRNLTFENANDKPEEKTNPSKSSKKFSSENATDNPEKKKSTSRQTLRRGTFLIAKTKMSQNVLSDSDSEHQKNSPLTSKINKLPQEKKRSVKDHQPKAVVTSNSQDDHGKKNNVDSISNLDEKNNANSQKTPKTSKKPEKKRKTFNLTKDKDKAKDKDNNSIEISNQVSCTADITCDSSSDTPKTVVKEKTTRIPSSKSKSASRRVTFHMKSKMKKDDSQSIEITEETPKRRPSGSKKLDSVALDSDVEPEITIIPDTHMKKSRKKRVVSSVPDSDEESHGKQDCVVPVDGNQKKGKSTSKKMTDKENSPANTKEHKRTPNNKKKDKKKSSKQKAKVHEEFDDSVPEVTDQPTPKQKKTPETKSKSKARGQKSVGQVKNEDKCKIDDITTAVASANKPQPVEQVDCQPSIEADGAVLPRQRSSRRNGGVVSYKEPSLNSKLRRGDAKTCQTTPDHQLSPSSMKKPRKSKRGSKSQKQEAMSNVTNTIDNNLQEAVTSDH
ncbi:dentin sialophosphoprotein-like isoform X2 [Anneissia japonica]|uniref:dentin sialophosphoprotein-like isoform X2 n=1 Tax=Anneissia japonica TaxID=1529436 RepID=UPI001425B9EB|nr:dentin sialophosphoprotein-like isoform X2 [Anneissia japonica]